jgi:hypothetical protein
MAQRWPFRKHPTADPDPDPELERVRALREKTERIIDQLERYANQLELALSRNERNGRQGGA